ncbi:hypothetical protein GOV07_01420 [Candidatus Woesearchaeota archaeon]|nr:hypothetical protein [Candidatus Woesearchaeota archaeon]
MEIEQFIEEDIRKFLDEELKEKTSESPTPSTTSGVLAPEEVGLYGPSRDYGKDLDDAIKDANRAKAQQILDDLKGSIISFPEGSPEQVERKRLVEKLYHRFQQGFNPEQEARVAALANELELMDAAKQEAPATKPTAPETPAPPPPPNQEAKPDAVKVEKRAPGTPVPHELSIEEEQSILADIQQVETLIAEHSYTSAIKQYQNIKDGLSIDNLMGVQRERILSRLMDVHKRIASRLDEKAMGGAAEEQRLNQHLDAATQAAETGNKAEAMHQYQSAKEIFMSLPEERRGTAQEQLLAVFERIKGGKKGGDSGALLDEEEKQLHGAP